MEYFIIFVFGFVIGWFALRSLVHYRLKQVRKILDQAEKQSAVTEVRVKFVKIGDQIYVHNSDTDEFLAQGTTKTQIVEILETRFPNVSFRASSENLKEVNLE